MKKGRIQNIAALIYEGNMCNNLGVMAEKHQNGISIETNIKEVAEKISATKEEIKEFLKSCFSEFRNLT
ncbi:MAG: hypothetical protein WC998_03260 [Candidatus Paceibacterota bacterium]|jgi:hypothetical protein